MLDKLTLPQKFLDRFELDPIFSTTQPLVCGEELHPMWGSPTVGDLRVRACNGMYDSLTDAYLKLLSLEPNHPPLRPKIIRKNEGIFEIIYLYGDREYLLWLSNIDIFEAYSALYSAVTKPLGDPHPFCVDSQPQKELIKEAINVLRFQSDLVNNIQRAQLV